MRIPKSIQLLVAFIVFLLCSESCEKIMPKAPELNQTLNAPLDGLTYEQNKIHLLGAAEFDEIYTGATGLGPLFVAASCSGCHNADSKGTPFTQLTRFGQTDTLGNTFLDQGGPQLQHNFLPGFEGEQLPQGASHSHFVAPIVAGLGFLELVNEQDIIALADPEDADADGVSGRINWNTLPDWVQPKATAEFKNGKYICRFGKKGSTYNLHQQVVQASNQDMGLTSTFMPQNPYNVLTGTQSIGTSDPDITDQSINSNVFYIQTLQAPERRNADDVTVLLGNELFRQIGCNSCHVEKLKTGYSAVDALSNKTFYPYTDMLLHDMGSALDDNYTEGTALSAEWKTPPLWGLGLSAQAQGGGYFLLHDGRAQSIEEAIEYHNGEAAASKSNYKTLSQSEKAALITFLNSL